jgi:hypothetical protein
MNKINLTHLAYFKRLEGEWTFHPAFSVKDWQLFSLKIVQGVFNINTMYDGY